MGKSGSLLMTTALLWGFLPLRSAQGASPPALLPGEGVWASHWVQAWVIRAQPKAVGAMGSTEGHKAHVVSTDSQADLILRPSLCSTLCPQVLICFGFCGAENGSSDLRMLGKRPDTEPHP
jgi:hypothetical protein